MNLNTSNIPSIKDAYLNNYKLESVIVSAYYKIQNKRDSSAFNEWIENFFYLRSPKIIYTNKETFENTFCKIYEKDKHIKSTNDKNVFINENNNSLFIIQELEDTFIWKNYKNLMELSEKKDYEIALGINHNKYLYTIWNNKSFWLKDSINYINSNYYYWTDIGCIRYNSTPEIRSFISSLSFVNRRKNEMIFGVIDQFTENDYHYSNSIPYIYYNSSTITNRIQGTFFGGGKDNLLEWCELYIDELNLFEKFKVFAGKDQNIMSSIYMKYKYKFDIFIPREYNNKVNITDIWFKFLEIFG
jgi:hypothetical protein